MTNGLEDVVDRNSTIQSLRNVHRKTKQISVLLDSVNSRSGLWSVHSELKSLSLYEIKTIFTCY